MDVIGNDWAAAGESELDGIVALRRAIHADPEIGLDCRRTTAKIKAALEGLPLEYRGGPSTSGLVAILRGGGDNGRAVLLRGDMDALPMQEETGLPFASQVPGAMHACGHDAHSAMLVGAAAGEDVLEKAIIQHEAGAVIAFLTGLEHEDDRSGKLVALGAERAGGADEHCRMGVVAAGVHCARDSRREG